MKKNRRISDIFPIGTPVFFHSGNHIGRYATVKHVDNDSKDVRAIFGFMITVEFDNGEIGYIEKSEHITKN